MSIIILTILKWAGRFAVGLVCLALVAGMTYLILVQPWHQGWGATKTEQEREFPGDKIVLDPDYQCTHAITIHAPAEDVWRWLVQIGHDRAGFYSYEWIERLTGMETHNADRIVTRWQSPEQGEKVGLGPGVSMEVAAIRRGRWLVFDMRQWAPASWAFVLDPIDSQTTRLVTRMRCLGPALDYSPFDPGHFIMERKMMLSIKSLAEGAAGTGQALSEATWFAAILIAAPGILILLFSKRWPWSLALAMASAAGWVLLLFEGHPSPVYGGLLVVALIAAHCWAGRAPAQKPEME